MKIKKEPKAAKYVILSSYAVETGKGGGYEYVDKFNNIEDAVEKATKDATERSRASNIYVYQLVKKISSEPVRTTADIKVEDIV
jgi:hypothetical protein